MGGHHNVHHEGMYLINIPSTRGDGLTKDAMQDVICREHPFDLSRDSAPPDVQWCKNILLHGTIIGVAPKANGSVLATVFVPEDSPKLSQRCLLDSTLDHPGESPSITLGKVNGC